MPAKPVPAKAGSGHPRAIRGFQSGADRLDPRFRGGRPRRIVSRGDSLIFADHSSPNVSDVWPKKQLCPLPKITQTSFLHTLISPGVSYTLFSFEAFPFKINHHRPGGRIASGRFFIPISPNPNRMDDNFLVVNDKFFVVLYKILFIIILKCI